MRFTDKQLNSFIKLYKQEFDENISKAEAQIQATKLVRLVKNTYHPITQTDLDKYSQAPCQNK